jgi:YggT family protein
VILHWITWLIELYVVILIVRALLSWFPTREGTGLDKVVRVFAALTEPVLRPVRRMLPPVRAGGTSIDLSVLVVIVALEVLATILNR